MLFDSLVTPSLMYASIVWAPGLPSLMWTQIERPLVTMLSRQLRSKSTVPHDIIRAEFSLPPMLVEPQDRISRRAFEASRSLHASGDTSSWYSIVVSWLLAHL